MNLNHLNARRLPGNGFVCIAVAIVSMVVLLLLYWFLPIDSRLEVFRETRIGLVCTDPVRFVCYGLEFIAILSLLAWWVVMLLTILEDFGAAISGAFCGLLAFAVAHFAVIVVSVPLAYLVMGLHWIGSRVFTAWAFAPTFHECEQAFVLSHYIDPVGSVIIWLRIILFPGGSLLSIPVISFAAALFYRGVAKAGRFQANLHTIPLLSLLAISLVYQFVVSWVLYGRAVAG